MTSHSVDGLPCGNECASQLAHADALIERLLQERDSLMRENQSLKRRA